MNNKQIECKHCTNQAEWEYTSEDGKEHSLICDRCMETVGSYRFEPGSCFSLVHVGKIEPTLLRAATVADLIFYCRLALEMINRPSSGPNGWHKSVTKKQREDIIREHATYAAHLGNVWLREYYARNPDTICDVHTWAANDWTDWQYKGVL